MAESESKSMFDESTNHVPDERLDQLGRALVRASALNATEAEAVASSPFLYARLRSRINAERERRAAGEGWLGLIGVVWRTAPAMALVVALAFILFWASSTSTPSSDGFSDEAILAGTDAGVERVFFTGANQMSNDEVLATILNEGEWEAVR